MPAVPVTTYRGLTTSQVRDIMPALWPTREPLYTQDMQETPFYGLRTAQGTYGAPPVSPTFVHFEASDITEYVADVMDLAFADSARCNIRMTGAGLRTELYNGAIAVDDDQYGARALLTLEPGHAPFSMWASVLCMACYNGMSAPVTFAGGKVRNSVHAFEGKVQRLADSVTAEVERATAWCEWVRTLEGTELSQKDARMLLAKVLNVDIMGQPNPRQSALLSKYEHTYVFAPNARPGTLRGILEAVTFEASHGSTRERPGALVPRSETEKREDGTLPGGRLRQPYDNLIREIEEMGLGLVLN